MKNKLTLFGQILGILGLVLFIKVLGYLPAIAIVLMLWGNNLVVKYGK